MSGNVSSWSLHFFVAMSAPDKFPLELQSSGRGVMLYPFIDDIFSQVKDTASMAIANRELQSGPVQQEIFLFDFRRLCGEDR